MFQRCSFGLELLHWC